MQRILEILVSEDKERFFTGDSHPNIYDAVAPIANTNNIKEIGRALKNYFEQVLQITQPGTKVHSEAQRMLGLCARATGEAAESMAEGKAEEGKAAAVPVRELSDEIVDFYMESLKHFASYVEEEVLNEHIRYLDE